MKEGWKYVTLPDISENLDSKRKPVTKGKRESGKYPYYGASGVVDYVSNYIFDDNLLLISEDGANLLARTTPIAFSVSGKIWVNNHAHVIKFDDLITQRFVEYYFASTDISDYVSGAAQPKFNQQKLNTLPIPFPPLSEQQQIVDFLDAEFAKIDELKKQAEQSLQNAKDLFQAALKEMLTPKEGWKESLLPELCLKIFAGGDAPKGNMSKTKTDEYQIPIYANAAENNGLYGYSNIAQVDRPSITIAARGSGTGLVTRRFDSYLPIVRLIVVIPDESKVVLDYLYYLLKTLGIKSAGSAIPQLTIPMLKTYKVCYPDTKEEQIKVVEELDSLYSKIQQLQSNYTRTIQLCADLKQALLKQVFE